MPGGSPTHSPVVGVDALGEGQLWGGPLNHSNQGDFKTLQTGQRETSHGQSFLLLSPWTFPSVVYSLRLVCNSLYS